MCCFSVTVNPKLKVRIEKEKNRLFNTERVEADEDDKLCLLNRGEVREPTMEHKVCLLIMCKFSLLIN